MRYDLAIIGSGGAAFAAAIAARAKGAEVVMVEQGDVGGTCVNAGCVPSKALLSAAEARHVALAQPFPGVATGAGPVDFAALMGGKAALVEGMRTDRYTGLAAEYGWSIVAGAARFAPGPLLRVDLEEGGTATIEAAHYLVATGSAPWAPPVDGLAQAGYLTAATAMELDRLPESMIVVGGGSIGLELGQLFARLGADVTVIEALDHLAPHEEPAVSAVIEGVFADEGIGVHSATMVRAVRHDAGGYVLTATRGGEVSRLRAGHLLVATGRRPRTTGLGLDTVGVRTGDGGEIVVDEHLRTGNERIWAAGDVTGHPQLVYVAAAHGALVADNALDGAERRLDYRHLPRVTFTAPAIAAVGLTEAEAVARGLACDCRVLSLEHVPRALVDRDTRGLVKLVAEAGTGRLLGAHVAAAGAGELVATAGYALAGAMTVQEIAGMWCPYLTMAEALKLAAQTYARDITKLSCCAA